jgi:hypothetical protein
MANGPQQGQATNRSKEFHIETQLGEDGLFLMQLVDAGLLTFGNGLPNHLGNMLRQGWLHYQTMPWAQAPRLAGAPGQLKIALFFRRMVALEAQGEAQEPPAHNGRLTLPNAA